MKKYMLPIIVIVILVSLIGSACSEAPAPAPAPAPKPTPAPTPAAKPTPAQKGSSWILYYEWRNTRYTEYRVYLIGFDRTPNPDREGWDRINAQFLVYHLPLAGSKDNEHIWEHSFSIRNAKADRNPGFLAVAWSYISYDDRFSIELQWDGGSKKDLRLVDVAEDPGWLYFQAVSAEIETDIPSIAKNLKLAPVTAGDARVFSGDAQTPNIWERESLQKEYQRFVDMYVLRFEDLSWSKAKYTEVAKRLEGNDLILEIQVENLSMQDDIDLSSGVISDWKGSDSAFLAADGTLIGRVLDWNNEAEFDFGDSTLLPPGFKKLGTLRLALDEASEDAAYVLLRLKLPGGLNTLAQLLPIHR